jgi:hypothetical protein
VLTIDELPNLVVAPANFWRSAYRKDKGVRSVALREAQISP